MQSIETTELISLRQRITTVVFFSFGAATLAFLINVAMKPQPTAAPPKLSSSQPTETQYVPGEVVVKFSERSAAAQRLETFVRRQAKSGSRRLMRSERQDPMVVASYELGLQEVRKIYRNELPGGQVRLLRFLETTDVVSVSERFNRLPDVLYAEPNYRYHTNDLEDLPKPGDPPKVTPNDSYYSTTGAWGQSYPDLWGLGAISAGEAWALTRGSSDVVVAVSDGGIDYTHADLAGKLWINPGEDLNGNGAVDPAEFNNLDDDGNGYIDDLRGWDFVDDDANPVDTDGHGTHVAGTISAATDNATGIAGVGWSVRLMAVRGITSAGGSASDLANTIRYAADQGADVINMSWGGTPSQTVTDAVTYAANRGVVLVAAAGNDNDDAALYGPANHPAVITVGAWAPDDTRATFSNFGEKLDVTAPGVEILSVRAAGTDMYCSQFNPAACTPEGTHIVGGFPDGQYYRANGTSMAAPHVAGVAALMLAADQADLLTPDLIKAFLQGSARDVLEPGHDELSGFGLLNAFGAVKAARAIAQKPELALTVDSAVYRPGSRLDVQATVQNIGLLAAPATTYRLAQGRDGSGGLLAAGAVPALSVGGSYIINEQVTFTGIPDAFRLDIDPLGSPEEYTPDNNRRPFTPDLTMLAGWPKAVPVGTFGGLVGAPIITDLDADGQREIVASVNEGVGGGHRIEVWRADGTAFPGWPQSAGMNVAVADLDADGKSEVVVFGQQLRVYNYAGALLTGWPQDTYYGVAPPALGDLDGNGDLEIVAVTRSTRKVFAYHHTGQAVSGWPKQPNTASDPQGAPLIADLNQDGTPEILIDYADGSIYALNPAGQLLPGWPVVTPSPYSWSDGLTTGDLDGDGDLEVLVGATDNKLYALHHTGQAVSGWPITFTGDPHNSSTGDLNGDGDVEVAVATAFPDNQVFVLDQAGQAVSGWPVSVNDDVRSTPTLADLDGDGASEVLYATFFKGKVYARNRNGTLAIGWPQRLGTYTWYAPPVADLNGDGSLEIVSFGAVTGNRVAVWTLPWTVSETNPWPSHRRDPQLTGRARPSLNFSYVGSPTFAEGETGTLTFSAANLGLGPANFLGSLDGNPLASVGASLTIVSNPPGTAVFSWRPGFNVVPDGSGSRIMTLRITVRNRLGETFTRNLSLTVSDKALITAGFPAFTTIPENADAIFSVSINPTVTLAAGEQVSLRVSVSQPEPFNFTQDARWQQSSPGVNGNNWWQERIMTAGNTSYSLLWEPYPTIAGVVGEPPPNGLPFETYPYPYQPYNPNNVTLIFEATHANGGTTSLTTRLRVAHADFPVDLGGSTRILTLRNEQTTYAFAVKANDLDRNFRFSNHPLNTYFLIDVPPEINGTVVLTDFTEGATNAQATARYSLTLLTPPGEGELFAGAIIKVKVRDLEGTWSTHRIVLSGKGQGGKDIGD